MGRIHVLRLLAAFSVESLTEIAFWGFILDLAQTTMLIVLLVMILRLQKKVGD